MHVSVYLFIQKPSGATHNERSSSGSAVLLTATGRERIAGAFTAALRDMVEAIKTRGGAAPEAAAA